MTTDDHYRKKWEGAVDESLRDINQSQLRQRNLLCELEIKLGKTQEELHDVHKAVDAIGNKLDSIKEEMPTIILFRDRVDSAMKKLWMSFITVCIGALMWVIVASGGKLP